MIQIDFREELLVKTLVKLPCKKANKKIRKIKPNIYQYLHAVIRPEYLALEDDTQEQRK